MPQDLKFEMEGLSRDEAIAAANFLAGVVGKAHARQMDKKTRTDWARELMLDRTKSWTLRHGSGPRVVDLVASHEAAYLNHCRHYALDGAGS